ncbi:hypothetical protein Mapa_000965 [Marchantia paleacea]|nr:hypothetical protein Mapa_000965 [Marchantia paleacea]
MIMMVVMITIKITIELSGYMNELSEMDFILAVVANPTMTVAMVVSRVTLSMVSVLVPMRISLRSIRLRGILVMMIVTFHNNLLMLEGRMSMYPVSMMIMVVFLVFSRMTVPMRISRQSVSRRMVRMNNDHLVLECRRRPHEYWSLSYNMNFMVNVPWRLRFRGDSTAAWILL